MTQVVLSLFPGIGMLDSAFEQQGFCVVRGPDALWGGDIGRFSPPAGRFDGVIGGPPCQEFSQLAYMVRRNGYTPKFGNLIPEFERCVSESRPKWFLMENVPAAPRPVVTGYETHSFTINNRQCVGADGQPAIQNRVRAITFGYRGHRRILEIDTVALGNQQFAYAACGGTSGEGGINRKPAANDHPKRTLNKCVGGNIKSRAALARLCELQGLAPDFFAHSPLTVSAACKAVGNGVPLPMGLALARAVRDAVETEEES